MIGNLILCGLLVLDIGLMIHRIIKDIEAKKLAQEYEWTDGDLKIFIRDEFLILNKDFSDGKTYCNEHTRTRVEILESKVLELEEYVSMCKRNQEFLDSLHD